MKNNYLTKTRMLIATMALLLCSMGYGQDIEFTFANGQNTNDGTNDYYEVDVLIATINTTGSFKLGSGQLYFNYSTAAFGASVSSSGGFEVTYPNAGGYICGQQLDGAAIDIYGSFGQNDNTTSRVSWNFAQFFSSSTFAADNVTDTPTLLAHLKFTYVDVLEPPMLTFEDGVAFDDQFFTACGNMIPDTGFNGADCTGFPGVQLTEDFFDSSGATLSGPDIAPQLAISIYPNPAQEMINIRSTSRIDLIEMFDILGKKVLASEGVERIMVDKLPAGIYLLKVYANNGQLNKKVVIE